MRIGEGVPLLAQHKFIFADHRYAFHITNKGVMVIEKLLLCPEIQLQYSQLIAAGCNAPIARLTVLVAAAEVAIASNLLDLPSLESGDNS